MKIIGKNVILRPIVMADAPRFVKWLSDPAVNKFTTRRIISLKAEQKWIHGLRKNKNEKVFALETTGGIHIGSCGIYVDRQDRKGTFGILIGDKKYWNKGIGTEASRMILDYAFKKLKLHRVELDVYDFNPRAIKIYKRLGFKYEGAGREHVRYRGKFYDEIYMGLLRREWLRRKR